MRPLLGLEQVSMDGHRFDALVRSFGKGASRRAILKGLLGLGGAAAVGGTILSDSDARMVGRRPTVPPPPTRTPTPVPTPTKTPTPTPNPCPAPNFTCGLDCCASELQCCDGECCPDGTVCLTRVFDEGPFVEEETCCPEELTCRDEVTGEGLCCDGECFDPEGTVGIAQLLNPELTCCPEGGEVCPGTNGTLCCQGETPDCCQRADGTAVCINAAVQCCLDAECGEFDVPETCQSGICRRDTQTCATAEQTNCPGEAPFCCAGGSNVCCVDEASCCQREGFEPVCIDPATQCCTALDCFETGEFDQGCVACPPNGRPNANTCVPRREGMACGDGECTTCNGQGQCVDSPCPPTTTTTEPPATTTTATPACLPVQSVCNAFASTCCQVVPTACSFEANCVTTQGEARCCRPIGQSCSVRCDCCDNADCVGGTCQLDAGQQCLSSTECAGADPGCCSGICRDLDNDINNCGSCGIVCQSATNPGEINTCIQGSCGVACADGFTLCGVFCVLLGSDENNCGTCGNDCASGETCCFGTCRDLLTDENSCGECGSLCPGTCCGGECEDLLIDELNCGACGHNCFFELCGAPSCGTELEDPLPVCCDGNCVDIANDVLNCGECGRNCPLGHECMGAICLVP
jgi:hypothetical protein